MGKAKGFLEYPRELPDSHPARERIKHWQEFHDHIPDEKLQQQGARCMGCGVPFCHTGELLSGMASGCPIHNLIPEWNDLVYRGRWRQALDSVLQTNNFPEFTGRVCPAPCEGSCVLEPTGAPVTIKSIEAAIIDRGFSEGWVSAQPPRIRTGKKVAIVGSGPAGLACADQLNQAGHTTTVFERDDRVGGLLVYGIPNMKLDKEIVQRRVDLMEAKGVRFLTHTEVGKDYSAASLLKNFDAVVLCCGATKPRNLPIEGRELRGVHFAMEYLHANTSNFLSGSHSGIDYISAQDKDVIVIGGGDTGTDCVGTAMRQRCRSLTQFEILPRPPEKRAPDNPWPEWPKVYRMDYGQEEASAVFGKDPRSFSIVTKSLEGDSNGQVKDVHTVRVQWSQTNGRWASQEIPGTERVWRTQLVLLALGFLGPEDQLLLQLGVERDDRSNARAEYGSYLTSIPGVFAAGDIRRGQSLVVWAINEGREAARECDRYLMGRTELP